MLSLWEGTLCLEKTVIHRDTAYVPVRTTMRVTHTGLACESRYDDRVVAASKEARGNSEINDSIEQNPAYGLS
jgi:hypothetical protein